jgi:hypothetical protein
MNSARKFFDELLQVLPAAFYRERLSDAADPGLRLRAQFGASREACLEAIEDSLDGCFANIGAAFPDNLRDRPYAAHQNGSTARHCLSNGNAKSLVMRDLAI